ncbi:MAG: peptidylprolyl isomerase [Pseudomonadota bacterium]|nr:peptidylprolyl isomerase [Pseudomonadota bacterium]
MVRMTTSLGVIEIELNEAAAPQTVQNFIEYANSGHYNGTIFHRVIPGFMIQGGGMSAGMQEKSTRPPIENEADNGLKNTVGTLAMARTNDPHSATSQFFINLVDNGFLDHTSQSTAGWGYAVFGRVTGGMDVVEQIAAVPTGTKGMHADVPLEDIEIMSVEVVSTDS